MQHTDPIRLATVLNPVSDRNLQLAAQTGVDAIVLRVPKDGEPPLAETQARVESFGMRVGVVEGGLPMDRIKLGQDDGTQLSEMIDLIHTMGSLGIGVVCYNFMAGTDWIRTSVDTKDRGGALVTAFDIDEIHSAAIPGREAYGDEGLEGGMTADALWNNLERFLTDVVPTAEAAGVVLAMHPDDPPVPSLLGNERIMNSVESFQRLVDTVPSRSNAIALCQGTFSEMGVDIPATIRTLGEHIAYVHFRDVVGTPERFVETWQDNGQTDMVAAMRAYRDVGFSGPMRPDHVPTLIGEEGTPGYTMMGRLYAYGYIRGLLQATDVRPDR